MKIDFKALAAGLLAALVVSLIAHAQASRDAANEKAGGKLPAGSVACLVAVRNG